jgi:hypothetical protein
MKSISIKSVLAGLSLSVDDRYWNEAVMLEHAAKGFLQMNLESRYEAKTAIVEVVEHKATAPEDLKYIVQVLAIDNNKTYRMRASTNTFITGICVDSTLCLCNNCTYEFHLSPGGVFTTSFRTGQLNISYLAVPVDEDGDILIPDDETVKEALTHYVLYKYWLAKDLMKEEGATQRVSFHLSMWSTLSKKALNLNLPELSVLENIKNQRNRLVPRTRAFDGLFGGLSSQENIGF